MVKEDIAPARKLKKQCKRGVLFSIQQNCKPTSLRQVERTLRNCGRLTKSSQEEYWRIRERLREAMVQPPRNFLRRWIFNWQMFRRMLAGTVTIAVVLLTMHTLFIRAPYISANSMSIHIIYGGVAVETGGQLIKGHEGQSIGEGDIIITGESENALIELNIFDNAVIRLGDNASVTIDKVTPEEDVILSLEGKIWVKTFEDESHLKIKASESTTITVPRGAVSILSNNRVTRILTRENIALVEVNNMESGVIKAQKVQVPAEHIVNIPKALQKNPEKNIESQRVASAEKIFGDENWIQENEEQDKIFKENLEQQKKEDIKKSAGVLPGSTLYTAKKLGEGARLSITTKNNQYLTKLDQATARLHEAVMLFEEEYEEEAEKTLEEYKTIITEISQYQLLGGKAEKVNEAVRKHLNETNNSLAIAITPDMKAYQAKEVIESLILEFSSKEEVVKEKGDIALDKLYEILNLLEEGNEEVAMIHFAEYADVTMESMDVAKHLLRMGESLAAQDIAKRKIEIELPLLSIIIQNSELLQEKAKNIKQTILSGIKEITENLTEKSGPTTVLTGVAVKSVKPELEEESITKEDIIGEMPSFRITGVAKK